MKIKELEVGEQYIIPLVVVAAVKRETKTKKPYLSLDFYDGISTISGNYWEWNTGVVPSKNTILNVNAQVTEWQGALQLNIKGMTVNTDMPLTDFMPSSGKDIPEIYQQACSIANSIQDDFLRALSNGVLGALQSLWVSVPGAVSIHHAYAAGTLIHSVSVACIAAGIAEAVPSANKDLVIAGGLLHDVGKLFGYTLNGVVCELTDEGKLYEHSFIGAEFIGNYVEEHFESITKKDEAKLEMLRHIILSHHGRLEHGAIVPPAAIEAHIVHHADVIDATSEQIIVMSSKVSNTKWTERIWALENKPHLTTDYVQAVMELL